MRSQNYLNAFGHPKFSFLKPVGMNGIKCKIINFFLYNAHLLHSTLVSSRNSGISVLVPTIAGLQLDLFLCLMSNELNVGVLFDTSWEVCWIK